MKTSLKRLSSAFLCFVFVACTLCGVIPAQASMESGEVWIPICNKYDFDNIRKDLSANYYLANDIEFEERDFIASGDFYKGVNHFYDFSGKLDGRGHSIIGLKVYTSPDGVSQNNKNQLFEANYGTIENIIFDNTTYTQWAENAPNLLVGSNHGTIYNLHIENDQETDLIVYSNHANQHISNCFITKNSNGCSFAMNNAGVIDSCYSESTIVKKNQNDNNGYGFCKSNTGTISNSIFNGKIDADGCAVGFATNNESGKIIGCVNSGELVAKNKAYGFSDYTSTKAKVNNCINRAFITGRYTYGIAPYAQDCINAGSYKLTSSGAAYGIGEECYNCYTLDTACSTDTDSSNVIKLEQLLNEDTYDSHFDFNNIWQIKDGKIGLQIENHKYFTITPYYMPTQFDFLIGSKLNTDGLLLFKFDNYGEYEVMGDDEYTVSGSLLKLGNAKITINSDYGTFYYYVAVYDKLANQSISVSSAKCYYNGSAFTPDVTIKTSRGIQLIKNKQYKVEYSSNTAPGKAKITITGLGDYRGTVTRSFIIYPAKASGLKMSERTASSISLSWTKQSGVTGYTIQKYNPSTASWSNVKTITSNTNSATISSLSAGKEYKFRVAAYKTVDNVKYYGSYSSSITKVTLPKKTSISSLSAKSGGFTAKWAKASGASGYELQYSTSSSFSSKKTITVSGNSKVSKSVTGLKKGKKYYVRVRSYKSYNGSKIYSGWSSKKAVTTKK